MYRAGSVDARGRSRVEVSVCPSRVLADNRWATDFAEWWLWSVQWEVDSMTNRHVPLGAPAWPFPGGLRRQPRPVFEACRLLRDEWPHLAMPKPKGE